jgi:DNA-binding LacI/PurR family transcriptional regulator
MDDMKSNTQAKVTLKTVAEYTGLTPGTISAVLNNTAGARRIPQATKDRVRAAARQLNYQPNPLARALRTGQVSGSVTEVHDFGATRGAIVIMDADHFTLAMNAIQQAGLRVPDDVSVVEFDSFPAAAMNYRSFEVPVKPS